MDTSVLGIYGDHLATLATHLRGHRLRVSAVMGALVVRDQAAELVVTCRPRADDGGRLWFYAAGQPLVEVDDAQMMGAVVSIKGLLA